MATATLSNGMATTTTSTTAARPDSEPFQNGLASSSSNQNNNVSTKKAGFRKPQISVEHADGLGVVEDGARIGAAQVIAKLSPISRRHAQKAEVEKQEQLRRQQHQQEEEQQEGGGAHLKVAPRMNKSTSLPSGASLEQFLETRKSPVARSVESSACNSSEVSADEFEQDSRALSPELYPDEISSGMSSDNESSTVVSPVIIPSVIDPDDEVFGDIDICNEADTKLVDWSFNVFVPACRTLLYHCADGNDSELASGQILADLRSLSNTINYFCTEQQRLSGQVKINSRGISSSLSTDRFTRIYKDKAKNLEPQQANSNTASMSSESSGFESQDSQYDRSYAVKILRSVSQSLIAPLLRDSDEAGFTSDLYKSIVQAIQKIAWKVEACLSFNDPSKQFDIYTKIFDEEQKRKLSVMMIRALPPEEPTLKNTAGRTSRTSSFSSSNVNSTTKDGTCLNPEKEPGRVIRRTPSGKARPPGMLIDSNTVRLNKQDSLEELDENRKSSSIEFENQFDMSFKLDEPPGGGKLRRINTIASPDRKLRISTNWSSFDEQVPKESSPHYFRPTHHRRTTISLSRKEVTKLGLTTARRVDDSISALNQDPAGLSEGATGQNQGGVEMEKVKSRLQEVLEGRAMRNRSASTSDLLEDTSEASASDRSRNHSFQVDKEAHSSAAATRKKLSLESPTLDKNLVKSYTPLKYQTSNPTLSNDSQEFPGDWTLIQDPGVPRDGTPPGLKPSKYGKGNRKSSRAKKALDKSLSASGRFRERVMKTAQALRRGSMSYSSSKKKQLSTSVVAGSMDQLLEDPSQKKAGSEGVRKFMESESRAVAQSEPASPLPKSETMPTKHKGKGTLSRIRPKSSRSVSASNTLSRKKKSSTSSTKSGFLANKPDAEGVAALTESIYALSNNAVQPSPSDIEDQLLITVDFSSKVPAKSKLHKKRSSLISSSSSSLWYAITITTTMKQFGRRHFTILRTIKQVITLYDAITTSHPSFASSLPSKPEKKAGLKLQKQQLEDFLNYISRTPVLRSSKPFVVFLMPDDEFGNFTETSEISFDLLMTFYTPDMYPGPPGSHNELHVVAPEDVPNSPSPSRSRRSSALPKKGTLHYVKKEGREDSSTFVIREEGQDALIVACEEDRYVVVAGTFEKLVEQLACEEKPDPRFVMTFLLGYRHFSNTMDLLTLLLRRFYMAVAPDATEEELSYAEKWRYVIQLRVLDILTYWLKKCWPDFYRDSVVLDKIREFIEQLKVSPDTNFQLAGTNLEKVLSDKLSTSDQYSVCSTPTVDHPPTRSRPCGLDRTISADAAHSHTCADAPVTASSLTADMGRPRGARPGVGALDIVVISAIQLARQLTLIELEALRTIDIHELVVYTWEANSPGNKPYRKHIDEYIARFNKLSFWIASEICSIRDAKTRGVLLEKFIDVAKHCQELKNFNSTISIMSGLSLAAVRRLKKSWEFVGERPKKNFEKMSIIMSPTNNHNSYRKLLSTVNRRDPCIPYFGVFMRDLTFFNDGNHKTLKNGLINFSKLRTMVYKFEELKRYQRSKYFFPPEDKVQEFCRNMWCLSESDLYDTSLEVEPREAQPSSSSTATPSLPAQHSRDTLSEPHPTPERDETDV